MTPVWALDIATDGTATLAPDTAAAPAAGASYRWIHCDLSDPALPAWAENTLPARAARGLLTPETRPHIDAGENGILATLRGVNLIAGEDVEDMVSVRLWITPTLIVSARERRIFALTDLRESAMAGTAPTTSLDFLLALADGLTARIETVSLDLDSLTDTFEDCADDGNVDHIPSLGKNRRKVIKLHRYVAPQAIALRDLAANTTQKMPAPARQRMREIANRAARTDEELAEIRDRLTALAEHFDLMQTTRQGRNAYVLSVIAAIFLPLGFLTGLFGVNVSGMPGIGWPPAFAVLTVATVVLGVAVYIILRWKRWL